MTLSLSVVESSPLLSAPTSLSYLTNSALLMLFEQPIQLLCSFLRNSNKAAHTEKNPPLIAFSLPSPFARRMFFAKPTIALTAAALAISNAFASDPNVNDPSCQNGIWCKTITANGLTFDCRTTQAAVLDPSTAANCYPPSWLP